MGSGYAVYKINNNGKGIRPKGEGKIGMRKNEEISFKKCYNDVFWNSHYFQGCWGSGEVRNTLGGIKICKILVFTSIIRVKGDDFAIKLFFYKSLKLNEYIMNFGFLLKWINQIYFVK